MLFQNLQFQFFIIQTESVLVSFQANSVVLFFLIQLCFFCVFLVLFSDFSCAFFVLFLCFLCFFT